MTDRRTPRLQRYKLLGRLAVPVDDPCEWARFMETGAHRVALSEIEGVWISTVFLGLDHRLSGDGEPELFETMINAQGDWGPHQARCTTWDQAEQQHATAVAMVSQQVRKAHAVTAAVFAPQAGSSDAGASG